MEGFLVRHTKSKGLFSSGKKRAYFVLDRDSGELAQFNNEKKEGKTRKVKVLLAKLEKVGGGDNASNVINITDEDGGTLVLMAENKEECQKWHQELNRDLAKAQADREARLQAEAAEKARCDAEKRAAEDAAARDGEWQDRLDEQARNSLAKQKQLAADKDAALIVEREAAAKKLVEQQVAAKRAEEEAAERARQEERIVQAKKEAEAKAQQAAVEQAEKEEREREQAAAKAKYEAEERAKRDAEQAQHEAEEKARLQRKHQLMYPRFSGRSSIYGGSPSVWDDYDEMSRKEQDWNAKRLAAKEASKKYLSNREFSSRRQQAATTHP